MKPVHKITAAVLMSSLAGLANASGSIQVVDGNLVVDLGNAASNSEGRELTLNPGEVSNEISYVFIDGDGNETTGSMRGFTGNVEIKSNIGKDTIKLLGLEVNNLTIDTGEGNDKVYLNLVQTNGLLSVRTGRGGDNVMILGHDSDGRSLIWTQGGADDVSISNSFFSDLVHVRAGASADTLSISENTFNRRNAKFNGQGGNNDTLIDDGTNNFQGGDPRITNFENIENPNGGVSCPVEDEARQVMRLMDGEEFSPDTNFSVTRCEVFTPTGAFGVYNGQDSNFNLGNGIGYSLVDGDNSSVVGLSADQAEACAAVIRAVTGSCNDFSVPQ